MLPASPPLWFNSDAHDRLSAVTTTTQLQLLSFTTQLQLSSKEFFGIQTTKECRFTLKCVRDIIITYNQMHRTDKYSQHSSII